MNWPHQPSNWSHFPAECAWYLLPGLLFHGLAFVLSVPLFDVLLFRLKDGLRMKAAMLFNTALLAAAMLANGFWSCMVWGRLYGSTDYISDYSAFHPLTRRVIDARFGEESGALNGISLFQLNGVWAVFTLCIWATALLITRRAVKGWIAAGVAADHPAGVLLPQK